MASQTAVLTTTTHEAARPSEFHYAFIIAWSFCLLFYFMQYAVRSAPSVMLPELTTAFGLTTLGVSSLLGLCVAGSRRPWFRTF
jgi:hypothetical protein